MVSSSYDPEREPTPERPTNGWRDWLRERRLDASADHDNEPEKLSRAKELKSAAKKRGGFWEALLPPRSEEAELAPKGEKLRKKWRKVMLKKSRRQLEEFREEEPETIDGYWLAQLMVAERIVKLHENLEQSKPKTPQRKAIKTELDVMGLLSEKLSDPTLEVPKEIEETHRAIVEELARSHEQIVLRDDTLPALPNQPEATPPAEEDTSAAYSRYGAAVLLTLRHALHAHTADPPDRGAPLTYDEAAHKEAENRPTADAPERESHQTSTRSGAPGKDTTPDMSSRGPAARPHATPDGSDTRPAGTGPATPAPIPLFRQREKTPHAPQPHHTSALPATVALTAAVMMAERYKDDPQSSATSSPDRLYSPLSTDTQHPKEDVLETSRIIAAPQSPPSSASSRPETSGTSAAIAISPRSDALTPHETHHSVVSIHESSSEHAQPPHKPFDHMSMVELLTLAQSVPVGHGKYLARAFETGDIGREGLIKVLKAHAKNGNYAYEFRRLSREYRRLGVEQERRPEALRPIHVLDEQPEVQSVSTPTNESNDALSASDANKPEPPSHPAKNIWQQQPARRLMQAAFSRHMWLLVVVAAIIVALFISAS